MLNAVFVSGCSQEQKPAAPPVMTADAKDKSKATESQTSSDKDDSGRTSVDGLSFEIPADWQRVQLSGFQMGIISARYTIFDGDEEITVTLSRSGGGIDANLDRWRGQVEASRDEVKERLTLAGQPAVLLDLEGRFSPGFGKPPADNQRMLGTIIEMPDQGYFVKLTGPSTAVAKVEDDFRTFLESAQRD